MHPLDNVIWQALTTREAGFAESFGEARRFPPEVSPLAGFCEPSPESYDSLAGLLTPEATAALFLAEPYLKRPGWHAVATAPLLQMVYDKNGTPHVGVLESEVSELTAGDSSEMVALAALTKPGPFNKRTHELGMYVGIRRDGKLVAMAGERLKVPGYTEVSAVCTHPEFAGHGYARILMGIVIERILKRGETPFLHVRENNARAIEIYQRLGFDTRVQLHLAVLRKDSSSSKR
jgi:predicted GNAT family acetyltransferase